MTINLREAIIERVTNKSPQELTEIIDGSIGGDEQALPGVGVLFEMIWQRLDQPLKDQLVSKLNEQLQTVQ